jgi:hypothetical protein
VSGCLAGLKVKFFKVALRKRLVLLSITHKLGGIEPKLEVGESGGSTPHDPITRRRVIGASEVAAKSSQLCGVEG